MRTWMFGVIAVLILAFAGNGFGQTMTDTERQEFEQFREYQKMKGKTKPTAVETVSKYAGLGKEIGQIMREAVQSFDQGMTVTEEHIYKFLNTTTGKLTMAIIVWKVMGHDIVSMAVGTILLIAFVIWAYKWFRLFFYGKTVMASSTGPWYNRIKTYKRLDPLYQKGEDGWAVCAVIGGACLFMIGSIAFFHQWA